LDVLRRDTEDSESNDTLSDDAGKSTLRCRCVDVLLSLVRIEQNIGKTELLATNTISTVAAAMRAMTEDTLFVSKCVELFDVLKNEAEGAKQLQE